MSAFPAWLDGMGALIHHSSGAYIIVSVATHLCPLDRRLLAMSLPLVGQHLFVLLKYWSVPLYCFTELVLEVIFEWEIFANLADLSFENGYDSSIRGKLQALCVQTVVRHSVGVLGEDRCVKKGGL